MTDPIKLGDLNFYPGGGWVWHGGVTLEDMSKGHRPGEPCPICDAPEDPNAPKMRVTSVDHETGTITIDSE